MSENRQTLHYVHRLRYTTQERLAGLFIAGALVLLFGAIIFSRHSSYLFEEKFELRAYMKNAQGISEGTRVKISGVDAGRVTHIDVSPDNRIEIVMKLRERFHDLVREDSVASLNKLAVLGDATIEIAVGSTNRPRLEDGASIRVAEAASLDELIARATPALESLVAAAERLGEITRDMNSEDVTGTFDSISATAKHLETVTARLADGKGAAGRLLADEAMGETLNSTLESALTSLRATEKRLNEMAPVLDHAEAATTELPQLIFASRQLVQQLNVTMTTLNSEVEQLPDMMRKTRVLMEETQRTLEAIQNTWPISSTIRDTQAEPMLEAQPPND